MSLPWPFETWRELVLSAALVVAIAVVAGLFLAKFPFPYQASSNLGFGAGWKCSYSAKGEPVCIKEIPKK